MADPPPFDPFAALLSGNTAPTVESSVFGATAQAPAAPVGPAPPARRLGARILLADSEHAFRSDTRRLLEGAGYVVEEASDSQEAVDRVRASPPDIAILDLHLAGVGGLQAARILRRNPLYASLPIIMMTRNASRLEKLDCLALDVDDFLGKIGELDELLARIGMILRRNKAILDSNALTHLPGNRTIESRISEAIAAGAPLAVMYFDLNNFKAYNDCYGYEAGDKVIHGTARLLASFVEADGGEADFLGHIGGDDFIYVTTPDRAEALAPVMCQQFEALAPTFYNEKDRAAGYIDSVDRQGNPKRFGLVGVAIGVAHNKLRRLESFGQVAQIGAELKHVAKEKGGDRSLAVFDRRSQDFGPENRTP